MRLPLAPAALALLLALAAARTASAGDPPAPASPPPSPSDTARKEAVERLEKDLRRMASSPRAAEKRDEIKKALESLAALGGPDAATASLAGLAFDDEEVEGLVLRFVETVHAKSSVAPLAALVVHRDYRRRFRLHAQIAHTFAVIADLSCLEPLTALVQSEEPHVVAAAADALATFKAAPHAKRVEPVRRLLDVYESTWNLKESHRPEDRIATDQAKSQWEVYGMAVRRALQALTGQSQLTKARDFRDWWNDHKKDTNW